MKAITECSHIEVRYTYCCGDGAPDVTPPSARGTCFGCGTKMVRSVDNTRWVPAPISASKMRLTDGETRALMRLGWEAASVVRYTGKNILVGGPHADGRLDYHMALFWAKAMAHAARLLRADALQAGADDLGDSGVEQDDG